METRANHLLVGSFVLVLFAGLIVFAIWLAKFQFDREFARYDIYFTGQINGLSEGSQVVYRGIPVGEVSEISIDPDNLERVVVTIEVKADTPVREDTQAQLEMRGITGGVMVQLAGGTRDAPVLQRRTGQRHPVIASRPSQLEQIFEDAPELVDRANLLIARANQLFDDRNRANFAATLENFAVLSGALAARADDIGAMVDDVRATTTALRETASALDGLTTEAEATLVAVRASADAVSGTVVDNRADIRKLIGELRGSAETLQRVSGKVEVMVDETRPAVRSFSHEGLADLTAFIAEARALVSGLNRVASEVERDPARFLFGNQQRGYEPGK
ncbi:MAG: MlaD family protein [Alphaproteobacteria bacterium]